VAAWLSCGRVCLSVCESVSSFFCTSISREAHERILTKLVTFTDYQVHVTLMTFSRSLAQRSRSQKRFPTEALRSTVCRRVCFSNSLTHSLTYTAAVFTLPCKTKEIFIVSLRVNFCSIRQQWRMQVRTDQTSLTCSSHCMLPSSSCSLMSSGVTRLVSPGAATDGVTLFSSKKN